MTLDELLYEFKALILFVRYIRDNHPNVYDDAINFSKSNSVEDTKQELFS
tara:strand:- start:915 stop:1064 length:150 start_codon:yes stop_codon:yes gene_type:complete